MSAARDANLAFKFLLELSALVGLAAWAAQAASGFASALLTLALPAAAAGLWGIFAAPRSSRRLPARVRIPFELCFFGLALVAFVAAGLPIPATIFGVCVLANAVLLSVFGDWRH